MQRPPAQQDGRRPVWRALLLVEMLLLALVLVARQADDASTLFTDHGPGLAALLLLMVLDVETARRLDDGTGGPRLPRGLIAWPLAAVMLTGTPTAGLVVLPVAGYALLRGPRGGLWPWKDSLVTALLASECALVVLQQGSLRGPGLDEAGGPGPFGLAAAALVCLAVTTALSWALAQTHGGALRSWVAGRLRTPGFYLAELTVLTQAVLVAQVLAVDPRLALFLAPSVAVAQRALQHAPLREAVDRDAKTGLLTFPAWERRAAPQMTGGRRCAVLLTDLDHFKSVNDRHGHLVGDLVLSQVARALAGGLRPQDLLGRFGGEEFCVLLPGADLEDALAVAERLRSEVALIRLPDPSELRITTSVGVHACRPSGPGDLGDALAAADRALYDAKHAGRDRVRHTGLAHPVDGLGPGQVAGAHAVLEESPIDR